MTPPKKKPFLHQHSLSLSALGVVLLLIVLYSWANPQTHVGSFFGNAIADWTGVFVAIVITKFLYEKGSKESKQPKGILPDKVLEVLREHSLTIFLVITGIAWVVAFGYMVSEWTQILGLVLMTKKLIEVGTKA